VWLGLLGLFCACSRERSPSPRAAISGAPIESASPPSRAAPGAPTVPNALADERDIRGRLQLPVEARLLSLSADPETAGTFGREGLRVVAMFEFTSADAESYGRRVAGASGWGELPIPAVVRRLREPPSELPSARRGLVYCRIGVWREGTEFNEYACGSVARPDHYRTAVLDLEHGKLTAVFKNYY
jgi:hypothetical protein